MSNWDLYRTRMELTGDQKREMWVRHSRASIARRMIDSPSSHIVRIDGKKCTVSVTHTQDLSEKKIAAIPGSRLKHGGLVDFAEAKWLITEVDADNEIYDRGLMHRCNYLLRWIGKDGLLKEKWCIVEDGTKYLVGERVHEMMTVGDARIAVTVPRDADTLEIHRGQRFLIDDPETDNVLAYQITKPNRMFNVYNGSGVFRYILTETNLTSDDNVELRIADYSNWKPDKPLDSDHVDSDKDVDEIVEDAIEEAEKPNDDDKKGWL